MINDHYFIGRKVRVARELINLTQSELSKLMGFYDDKWSSDVESGKHLLSYDELIRLSSLLNKDIEYFLDPFNVKDEMKVIFHTKNRESDS